MTKLNFEKFPCYTDIRKEEKREFDIKFQIANQMYLNGGGVAMGALALKIYNSNGEQDYNEQECAMIIKFAQGFTPVVYDSIKDHIEAQKEKE